MAPLMLPYEIRAVAVYSDENGKVPRGIYPKPVPRRMSRLSNAALCCVAQLVQKCGDYILQLPLVYASRHGELERTHALFDELKTYGEMSPAGFSLSVHNATASLLGLTSGSTNNSTTLAAGPDSLAMGIMEATMLSRKHNTESLMVYGDCFPELQAAAMLVKYSSTEPRSLPQTLDDIR